MHIQDEDAKALAKKTLKVGGGMALVMFALVLAPPVAAIAGGVAIFSAPAVAALGFVPQLGLAVAGGLGIGFLTRIVTTVVSIPLLGYMALKGAVKLETAVSEAAQRAETAAGNEPAPKVEAAKPAAEFKQAAEAAQPTTAPAAEKTTAAKAEAKPAKKAG